MKNKEQFKQLKQLAKEAYNSKEVCQEWKDKILDACPEFRKTHKTNTWYIGGGYLFFLKEIDENRLNWRYVGYGFEKQNEWGNELRFNLNGKCFEREATEEEVKEALIKELFKKGLKEGSVIKCVDGWGEVFYNKEKARIYYEKESNSLWVKGLHNLYSICLFLQGKWAEIIQDPKEIEVEHEEVKPNILELNGKKYKLIPID